MLHSLVVIVKVVILVVIAPFIPSRVLDMIGQLLQARPVDLEGWVYYGSLLEKRNYDEAAAATYRIAVRLQPNHRVVWRKLGEVLTRLGDFEGADEAFKFTKY